MVGTVATGFEPRRLATAAKLWKWAGFLMAIPGLGFLDWARSASDQDNAYLVFWGILGLGLFLGALACYRRGKKIGAIYARHLIEQDKRPPVLYLRSFKDDPRAAAVPTVGIVGFAAVLLGMQTEEEQLAEVMDQIGPFLAIGKPGEPLPEVGAARIYVGDGEWQLRVSELMSQARLVVLRAGETSNLWWEVKTAAEIAGPEKLLFLLPFGKKQYEVFRETAKEFLPSSLPDFKAGRRVPGSRIRAVLYFDRDWTPHLEKIKAPWSLSFNPMVGAFRRSLQPLIERERFELKSPHKRSLPSRFVRTYPGAFVLLAALAVPGHEFVQGALQRSAVAHNDLGFGLYRQHDLDGAIREYRSALRFNPQLATAHTNLALALHDERDVMGALWECSEALRLAPELAMAHNNLGLFYYEIATSWQNAPAELLYDRSHGAMYNPSVERALQEYRTALRLQPDLYEPHQNLADALRVKGDLDAAIGEYHECLRLQPSSAVAHNNLGAALERKGDATGALREYEQAFRLAPDDPVIRQNYERLGR
jgi:Flp pilus assembly protein TadD